MEFVSPKVTKYLCLNLDRPIIIQAILVRGGMYRAPLIYVQILIDLSGSKQIYYVTLGEAKICLPLALAGPYQVPDRAIN